MLKKYAKDFVKIKNKIVNKQFVVRNYNEQSGFTLDNILRYNEARNFGYEKYICNAPFVSLYFGLLGEISVCCLNRTYLLGNIKQDKVADCWNGERMLKLRTSIANQKMNLGCQNCKHQIISGNYNNLVANEYDGYFSNKFDFPKVITFELSNTCNLACVFCSGIYSSTFNKHFEGGDKTDEIYDKDFILQIKPFLKHLKKANFLGGEPFLIDIYMDIIDELIKENPKCEIHIQTNGQVFNNRVKRILNKGNVYIGISLETVNNLKFSKIRTFGSLEKLKKNISNFRNNLKNKNSLINLSVTPINSTVSEVLDILEFANTNNFKLFFNILYSPYKYSLWSMPYRDLELIMGSFDLTKIETKNPLEKENLQSLKSYLNLIDKWIQETKLRDEYYDLSEPKDKLISKAMKKIERFFVMQQTYSVSEQKDICKNLNTKLREKLNQNNLYHRILYDLLTMSDDVLVGCVYHYSF